MGPNGSWDGIHEQILAWNRGSTQVLFEGFQRWALASLRTHLGFDDAIWGFGLVSGSGTTAIIHLAQVHRQGTESAPEDEALPPPQDLARYALSTLGRALPVSSAPLAAAPARSAGRALGLCIGTLDAETQALQFLVVRRAGRSPVFSARDAAALELLAPHMMQAYSIQRDFSIHRHQPSSGRPAVWTTAIVDQAGVVYNRDAGFAALFQREWPQWDGSEPVEALKALLTDHGGDRFRFVGRHVVAEFSPTRDLYLLSLRLRASEDLLSEQERRIARQYAAGASYKEIAGRLNVSPPTVRARIRMIFLKLGINKKTELGNFLLQ